MILGSLWCMCHITSLTHCGPVTPYGDIGLSQYWLRKWLVAWRHQAIAWTNVEFPFCGIHLRAISQQVPKILYCIMSLKIRLLELNAKFPRSQRVKALCETTEWASMSSGSHTPQLCQYIPDISGPSPAVSIFKYTSVSKKVEENSGLLLKQEAEVKAVGIYDIFKLFLLSIIYFFLTICLLIQNLLITLKWYS